MKTGHLKNSITYIFLALFISMNLAGLHALTHQYDHDQITHCAVCHQVKTSNQTPALLSAASGSTPHDLKPGHDHEIVRTRDFLVDNTPTPDQLYSRPPPFP